MTIRKRKVDISERFKNEKKFEKGKKLVDETETKDIL